MAGAYRFLAVLIAVLSLTLAQLPQEFLPDNAPDVNLPHDAPPYPSGLPGILLEGYSEMPPANPFLPSHSGFSVFSEALNGRKLSPIPLGSIQTFAPLAENRPARFQTVPDNPIIAIPGVSPKPVNQPNVPNYLRFPSPFGMPGPLGIVNPLAMSGTFDPINFPNQLDLLRLPISFGQRVPFRAPLQIKRHISYPVKQSVSVFHDFNHFPGIMSPPSTSDIFRETPEQTFKQILGGVSAIPTKETGTRLKESFPDILRIFHKSSPLSRVKFEKTDKQISGLFSASLPGDTAENFKQIHPIFSPDFPIVSEVNIERRYLHVPNIFPGSLSRMPNMNAGYDFHDIPWYIHELASVPVGNVQDTIQRTSPFYFSQFPSSMRTNVRQNVHYNPNSFPSFGSLADMKTDNIQSFSTIIPGLSGVEFAQSNVNRPEFAPVSPFSSDFHLNIQAPIYEDLVHDIPPLNALMTGQSNENSTTLPMIPEFFELPLLEIPLENSSPIHHLRIGSWPLLPQVFLQNPYTITPDEAITPIQVAHLPANLPTMHNNQNPIPSIPVGLSPPFPGFKRPLLPEVNQRISQSPNHPVVDSTTSRMPYITYIAPISRPEKGGIVSPVSPLRTTYISHSTAVPPITTSLSPSTAAPPTTTYIPSPSTVAPTTTTSSSPSPSTVAPTTSSPSPSTVAPITTTTYSPSPSTVASPPPTTSSPSLSAVAPPPKTTYYPSPSTVAPPPTTTYYPSPSTVAPPPTTTYSPSPSTVAPPTTTTYSPSPSTLAPPPPTTYSPSPSTVAPPPTTTYASSPSTVAPPPTTTYSTWSSTMVQPPTITFSLSP